MGRDGQLQTSIYDKRDIFISTTQTIRSWVLIFHLRQSMAFSSHNTICPGSFVIWMFCSEGRETFSIQLKQGYLTERLKSTFREFEGWYRDLIKANINSDIPLETAAIFSIWNRVLARCISWLISFAWAYSSCEEREPRITKWKILANSGIRTRYLPLTKRTR